MSVPVRILSLPGASTWWPDGHEATPIDLGNFIEVIAGLRDEGWTRIVMAGAVKRPEPAGDDYVTGSPPRSPVDLAGGDDQVLRRFMDLLEGSIGMEVVGIASIAPDLVDHTGSLTNISPSGMDMKDIRRGCKIAGKLGEVDVGQGVVVIGGLCAGIETITGTDSMLRFVSDHVQWSGQGERRGVMVKRSKPGQDLRVDLPTIGPRTLEMAARAGLAGIAIESGRVILVDRETLVGMADREGMFIWSEKYPD